MEKKDELDEAAGKLSEIADEIPFTPPDIEMDSPREISKATLKKQIQFPSNPSDARVETNGLKSYRFLI